MISLIKLVKETKFSNNKFKLMKSKIKKGSQAAKKTISQ